MKKILITGKDSYIGTSFEKWVAQWPDKYIVDTVDMIDGSWKEKDFSKYDAVFHVAGIAHIKETKENKDLYYKVNRDLAHETAKKAKAEGVQQFIFLSTMSVYGINNGIINKSSPTNPKSNYAKSKLQGECKIKSIESNDFITAILRPPMVYGRGCKGNYSRLARLAIKTPVFPRYNNKRSMLNVDNLSEFVKQIIDNCSSGLFFPQNAEYVNTSEMVKLISKAHGKRIWMTRLFNPFLRFFSIRIVRKVFGDLVYDMGMSEYESDYRVCGFRESINNTEMYEG